MVRVVFSTTDQPLKRHPRNKTRVSFVESPFVFSEAVVIAALIHGGTPLSAVVKLLDPNEVTMVDANEYLYKLSEPDIEPVPVISRYPKVS
jgi:hypothetical protein